MQLLKQPWGGVRPRLGQALPLCCSRHPTSVAAAYPGRPFPSKFCPNVCGESYEGCDNDNHICTKPCHPGTHEKCPYPCEKILDCG